jgi:hypothetical protein
MGPVAPDLEIGELGGLFTDGATGPAPLRGAEAGLLGGTITAPDRGIGVGLSAGGVPPMPPDFGPDTGPLGGAAGEAPPLPAGVLGG